MWVPELDTIQETVRTGSSTVDLPAAQVEQRDGQSREAEESLIQDLYREDEANARKREKSKKKKEKRARSSHPETPQPTVALLDFEPPPESSSMTRR